jgi:hypothetical protein
MKFGDNLKDLIESFGIEVSNEKKSYQTLEDRKVVSKTSLQDILNSMSISQKEVEQLEIGGGIELDDSNEDITFTEDGLFYKGRRVVLHISEKDTESREPEDLPKYHLRKCGTLTSQQNRGNLGRYRISLSKNGKFHFLFGNKKIPNQELHACKNCLNYFENHKNIHIFSLQSFLETHSKDIPKSSTPKLLFDGLDISGMDMDYETLPNEYRKDWKEVSVAKKKAQNYTCEECGWKPRETKEKRYIHVHHFDKNRRNNWSSNLKVLCIDCHYNYHPTLKGNFEHKKFLSM